jgi:hypothetical protein
MTMWPSIRSVGVFVVVCVSLLAMQAQRPDAAGEPGGGQAATPAAPAARGGQRGGGGRADAPQIGGPGNLLAGVWGADPTAVDSRDWGWMTRSYVGANYKRPFYNKAKEMLFSGKQVTSYTISSFDPPFYCEVRKHYGYVWFEMQHSTMSWDNVAKMIAACPGPRRCRSVHPHAGSARVEHPEGHRSRRDRPDLPDDPGWQSGAGRGEVLALPAVWPPQLGLGQAGSVWAGVPGGYQNTFNDNMLVVVMLETLDGIINADEIANTFGIDVVIQGNNDLSRFSGWSQTDPRYQSLLTVSRNATLHAGKFWGQRRRAVPDRQPAECGCAVRAERAVDRTAGRRRRGGAGTRVKSRRSACPMGEVAAAAGADLHVAQGFPVAQGFSPAQGVPVAQGFSPALLDRLQIADDFARLAHR